MWPFKKKVVEAEYVAKYPDPRPGEVYVHRYVQWNPFLKNGDPGTAVVVEIKDGWAHMSQRKTGGDDPPYSLYIELGKDFDLNYTKCANQ